METLLCFRLLGEVIIPHTHSHMLLFIWDVSPSDGFCGSALSLEEDTCWHRSVLIHQAAGTSPRCQG